MPAPRTLGPAILWAVSILVGIVAGLGAVAFRALIGFFHNLLFLGRLSTAYNANVHTPPGPWGAWVVLVPVAGALGVSFLVKTFAPEAKGHGVPEVMDAVYNHRGIIRPVVSVVKALASALSIGSGGSIGREGPIIQIGASFGSTVGQFLGLSTWQRITLIAAGAGGGIAATFNTPVGGVLFAVEIVMHEVSARTLVPVVTATAIATYIGQLVFGPHPSFFIPELETTYFHLTNPLVLIAYAALGALTGLISALFIRSIYGCEHFFEAHIKGGYYAQHALGMLIVGLMLYAWMSGFGHYYVEGVGYATIQDVLTNMRFPLYLLVLLFVSKLLATSLTLGSGASGGVFSPALFLGAIAGAAYGAALNRLFPSLNISTPAFAVAGMGGVVGGATGAAMAAIVMIFEMTLDYTVILPMTITVAISYAVRRSLMNDSIYTRKLVLRGAPVPETLRADLQYTRHAASIMNPHVEILPAGTSVQELTSKRNAVYAVKDQSGALVGVSSAENLASLHSAGATARIGDLVQSNYVVVPPRASLWSVVDAMRTADVAYAAVAPHDGDLSASDVQGVISRKDIVDTLSDEIELFGV
jgi:chloride channel protein, CIC family